MVGVESLSSTLVVVASGGSVAVVAGTPGSSSRLVEVSSGRVMVGLGTGRAASRGIKALAERVKDQGLEIECVATSDYPGCPND